MPRNSLLSMYWLESEDLDMTVTTSQSPDLPPEVHWSVFAPIVDRYSSPAVETPIEVSEMKINPKEFKYDGYYFHLHGGRITEDEARENMSDYYYRNWNPMIFRKVTKHYHLAGPDAETCPTKRKFYNALSWYRDYYDGRHGQKTDIDVEEIDISAPIWQKLVLAMAVSEDFTLQEALYTVATACDRCRHALLQKYYPESCEGYAVHSDKYQQSNARCEFCRYY